MCDARAIGSVHDGAVGTDDIHNTAVFQRAVLQFMLFQTLGVPSSDVALQPSGDGRAELGRDARPWMLKEWKDRRCALKNVAYWALYTSNGGWGDYFYQ